MFEGGYYPWRLVLYEETNITPSEIEKIGNIRAFEYYLFIMERKKEEKRLIEKAQSKRGTTGSNVQSFECSPPEGAQSWEEWERDIIRKKELERLETEDK